MITTKNLTRRFKSIKAVEQVSLHVPKGAVFGLLGPNGAGKTTLISMLITLMAPTFGSAQVCGFDLARSPHEIRKRIGVVFQETVFDEELSAFQNLEIHARLYKIQERKRVSELIKLVNLDKDKNRKMKEFSGGMKRKVDLARSLLHSPELLFLDEPSLGLDPAIRKIIWEHIRSINKSLGTTILIGTNYMEEAQYLCTHIGIMKNGRLVISESKESLLGKIRKDKITIQLLSDTQRALKALKRYSPRLNDSCIVIDIAHADKHIHEIASELKGNNVLSINIVKPNLEDVFLKYTGENL
jgi:ABC-2 type transport system ATP-binding protein